MRRPTLEEKRYGPGFRPGPSPTVEPAPTITYRHCAVDECPDTVFGTAELWVDDVPPMLDWYSKLLKVLKDKYPGAWVVTPLCQGHLEGVVQRSEEMMESPELWAPGRENPPMLPRPPKILKGVT